MKRTLMLLGAIAAGCAGEDPAGPATEEWATLIEHDWTLDSGTEEFQCVYRTLTEDVVIRGFSAIAAGGTHHTVLSVGEPRRPDGVYPCAGNTANGALVYGTGVGTDPMMMPEGVGVRMRAGQQLNLNLHLYNTTATVQTGTSGTRALLGAAGEIAHDADGTLMGSVDIDLPAGKTTTVVGGCVVSHTATIFSVLPHMHTLGRQMKIVAETAAGDVVLFDGPYDFEAQRNYPTGDVPLAPGDRVRVECTYDNTTSKSVGFGDSTDSEMCFAAIGRYPATGQGLCVDYE